MPSYQPHGERVLMIQELHALCQNSQWVDAFERFITFRPLLYTPRRGHHMTTHDPQWLAQAWRSLLCGETRLLQRACAAAVSENDVERVQRWSASLQPA